MRSTGWVFDTRLIVDEEKVINSGLNFWRLVDGFQEKQKRKDI